MIASGDRAFLAPGVAVVDGGLHDNVRAETWPLNGTARFIAERADGRTLGAIAAALAERFDVTGERAALDVRVFAHDLNGKLLLNVAPQRGAAELLLRWLALALRLLPLRTLPKLPMRRRRVRTESALAAVVTVTRGLALQALAVAVATGGGAAFLLASLGVPELALPLAVGASAGVGLIAHEAGHAVALRGVPCCLGTRALNAFILHPPVPPRRRALVASAGPAAALALGALTLVAALILTEPYLALAATVLASHGIGLTVAGDDGRTACAAS